MSCTHLGKRKNIFPLILTHLTLLTLSLSCITWAAINPIPEIEILIASSVKKITMKGVNLQKEAIKQFNTAPGPSLMLSDSWSKKEKRYPGQHQLTLDCLKKINFSSSTAGQSEPTYTATLSSNHGPIEWDRQHYQGKMNVIRQSNQQGCDIVQRLSLENYLATLLGKEMNHRWPIEALKAQAVAARSYALYKIEHRRELNKLGKERHYDLMNSELDQVNGSIQDITSETVKATYYTQGEVLVDHRSELSPAFYHAKCGGQTFLPEQIWKESRAGYGQQRCQYCLERGPAQWSHLVSPILLVQLLCQSTLGTTSAECQRNTPLSGKMIWEQLKIYHHTPKDSSLRFLWKGKLGSVSKAKIRQALGRKQVPSHYFTLSIEGERIYITGAGHGHGVGLCQHGAMSMAKKGFNYQQILSYYYPKLHLKKIY